MASTAAAAAAAAAGPVHQCKDRRRGLVGRPGDGNRRDPEMAKSRKPQSSSRHVSIDLLRALRLTGLPSVPNFRTPFGTAFPSTNSRREDENQGWHRQEYRTLQKMAPGIWPTTAHACQHQQKLATLPNIRCAEIADASPPQLEACSFENGQFASCWRRDCGTNDLLHLNWHEGYGPCADTGTHGQCSFELLTPLLGTPICPHREGQTPSVTVHHCPRG